MPEDSNENPRLHEHNQVPDRWKEMTDEEKVKWIEESEGER